LRDLVQRDELSALTQIGRDSGIGDFILPARASGEPAHDLVVARNAFDEQSGDVSALGKRERLGAVGRHAKGGVDDHASAAVQPGRGLIEQRGISLLGELAAVGTSRVALGEALGRRYPGQAFADFVGAQPLESESVRQTPRDGRFAAAG
jgi:hypothetical protein